MFANSFIRTSVAVIVTVAGCAAIAVGASTRYFPLTTQTVNVAVGEYLFNLRCASCHAVKPDAPARMGPNLATIGTDAGTRKPGLDATGYLLESILRPEDFIAPGASGRMPAGLADDLRDEYVRSLLGYLLLRGGEPDYAELTRLQIERPSPVPRRAAYLLQLRRGEKLFSEELGCAGCHGIHEDVGESLIAPGLSKAGLLTREYVETSVRDPSAHIAAGYAQVTITRKDGSTVSGRLWSDNEEAARVLGPGADGPWTLHTITAEDQASRQTLAVSTMPPYNLTRGQMTDLLAFIGTLNAEADHLRGD